MNDEKLEKELPKEPAKADISKEVLDNYNKALLEKLDEQIKNQNKIFDELKSINERAEKEKQEKQEAEEQEKNAPVEQTTEEKILEELKHLSELTSSEKDHKNQERITKLLEQFEEDYKDFHFQTSVINSYGVLIVPGILVTMLIAYVFKQFINW